MLVYEEAYEKVSALKKAHPDTPIGKLIARADVTPSNYYAGKRAAAGQPAFPAKQRTARAAAQVKAQARANYARLETPPAAAVPKVIRSNDQRMVFIMGTPEQIKSIIATGGLL